MPSPSSRNGSDRPGKENKLGAYIVGKGRKKAKKRRGASPRQSKTCAYCGVTMRQESEQLRPTKDHVVPKRLGGRKKVAACNACNHAKGGMTPAEWLRYVATNMPHRHEAVFSMYQRLGIRHAFPLDATD